MYCQVNYHTLTSACGSGNAALNASIDAFTTCLVQNDYPESHLDTWIGRVNDLDHHVLPESLRELESRNNRLADLALAQDDIDQGVHHLAQIFGPHRVGVLVGTSTSSIGRTEAGYRNLDSDNHMPAGYRHAQVHNPHSPSYYVAKRLGLTGPAMTISTACSSSSKVFCSAERWLRAGIVDAVLVGGVDSLCLSILHGFASLELTSPSPCRPFDIDRTGISIGEAAGFALLTRLEDAPQHKFEADILLNGIGESSDAHHMAQPHPEGEGARLSMAAALASSSISAHDIGYINLHGTASRANDIAESVALASLFEHGIPVSSTKAWTGHTLGAAGITGAVIAIEALKTRQLPGTLHLEAPDPELAYPIASRNSSLDTGHVMTNSFGFGGNNCSLIFSRQDAL